MNVYNYYSATPPHLIVETKRSRTIGFAPPVSIELVKGIRVKESKHYPESERKD